jgi:ATP11 protein
MKLGSFVTKTFTCELNSILKTEAIKNKPIKEIVEIWNNFHGVLPNTVSIALSLKKTEILIERMKSHPLFIQPIIRYIDYFFLLSRLGTGDKIIGLYKVKENENDIFNKDPDFILRIFNEFSETKKINLVRGDLIEKTISKTEADIAMRGLLGYYVDDELFNSFVVPFNEDYMNFKHNQFLEDYLDRFHRRDNEDYKI